MIDDTRLMQLWHTGEAAASIARRTGERADSILARWRQLQQAALLPEHARPPMQQDSRDGRPQAGDGGDPLLEKLIEIAECVALCEELAPRLAEVIADKLNERTPLMMELRPLGPYVLAIAALSMALESIVMERGEPEATIALGRAVQGELWARKQPRKTRTKIIKSADPKQASREAGYSVRDWPRSRAAQVGNFLKGALLEALPAVFALRDPTETLMEARYNAARARKKLRARKLSVPHELCITTGGEARAMQLRARLRWMNPSFVPCTEISEAMDPVARWWVLGRAHAGLRSICP